MKLQNGTNKILFSCGKLYLNGIQIAGEGIVPSKDIMFEFHIKKPENKKINESKDPSILEVNVFDEIPTRDLGPGQR